MVASFPEGRELPQPAGLPASERQVLVEFLDFYRAVLVRKAEGLTADELNRTTSASNLTLGGLVKHMALVEDIWFVERFSGEAMPDPWSSAPFDDDGDWELTSAADDSPAELLTLFDQACARSRAIVDAADSLDEVTSLPADDPGRRRNLRWILVHMIEEYARHAGHADLLREEIDGRVGS
jgi:uncharacterized damage-inducible protein DinB